MIEDLRVKVESEGVSQVRSDLAGLDQGVEAIGESAQGTNRQLQGAGRAAQAFGRAIPQSELERAAGLVRDANGRLRDSKGRFVGASRAATIFARTLKDVERGSAGAAGSVGGLGDGLGDLGDEAGDAAEAVEDLTEEIAKLDQETAKIRRQLRNSGFRRAFKEAADAQRQLDRLGETAGERFQRTLETFENVEGAVGAIELLGGALVGLYALARQGAALKDLDATFARLGRSGASSASAIQSASGGRLTRSESQQLGLRGALGGLNADEQAASTQLARVLASQQGLTGDTDDVRAATLELSKGIQDELKAGELGESLQQLGVNTSVYQRALEREARTRGVTTRGLDVYTRRQILLNEAIEAGADRARLFETSGIDAFTRFEAGLARLGERTAASLTTIEAVGVPVDPIRDSTARRQVEERAVVGRTQQIRNAARGRGEIITTRQAEEQARAELEVKREQERLEAQASARRKASGAARLAIEQNLNRLTAQQKEIVGQILTGRDRGLSLTTRITKAQREILTTEGGLSKELAGQLNTLLLGNDRRAIGKRLQAEALTTLREELAAKREFVAEQRASEASLTASQRIQLERKDAALAEQEALAAQASSVADFNAKAKESITQLRLKAGESVAFTEQQRAQAAFQTQAQRDTIEIANKVAGVKSQAADLSTTWQEYAENVTRAALVTALDNNAKLSERIEAALKGSSLEMADLVDGAARFASALPGARFVAERLLSSVTVTDEEAKKRAKKPKRKKKEDPTALLREADQIGLDEFELRAAQAQARFEDTQKKFKGNAEALAANARLLERDLAAIDLSKRLEIDGTLAERAERALVEPIRRAAEEAKAGLSARAEATKQLEEARFQASLRGLDAEEQIAQASIRAAQNERDAKLKAIDDMVVAESEANELRLEARLGYLAAVEEMEEAAEARQRDRWATATEGLREAHSATLEFERTYTDQLLEEEQRRAEGRLAARGLEGDVEVQLDAQTQALFRTTDALMTAGIQVDEVRGRIEHAMKTLKSQAAQELSQASAIAGATAQIAQAAGAPIQAVAAIKGAEQLAEAAAAGAEAVLFPFPFAIKAAAHGAAAAQFFAIAGGAGGAKSRTTGARRAGGGGGGGGSRSRSAARPRSQSRDRLSRDPSSRGRDRDRRQNTYLVINPITGTVMFNEMNRTGFRDLNQRLDSNLVAPTGRLDL